MTDAKLLVSSLVVFAVACSAHGDGSDESVGETQQTFTTTGAYTVVDVGYSSWGYCPSNQVLVGVDKPTGNGVCKAMSDATINYDDCYTESNHACDSGNDEIATGYKASTEQLRCCSVSYMHQPGVDNKLLSATSWTPGLLNGSGYYQEFLVCNSNRAIRGWNTAWYTGPNSPYNCWR